MWQRITFVFIEKIFILFVVLFFVKSNGFLLNVFCVCQCVWYLLIKILKQSTNVMERLKEKYNILILSVCALMDLGNWGNILIELLIEVSFSLASLIAMSMNDWLQHSVIKIQI